MSARIDALEGQLEGLRQLEALAGTIATVVGPGVAFSARELFDYRLEAPELAAALEVLHIRNPRQLGKKLRALCGSGLERASQDHDGALWVCM